ncbi:hypothetical protein LTR29_017443 [Friedmanniomyces endolithicus]|nr:hypothetical protein LTR29_017443 [Friedmanniomyces endolithicus]
MGTLSRSRGRAITRRSPEHLQLHPHYSIAETRRSILAEPLPRSQSHCPEHRSRSLAPPTPRRRSLAHDDFTRDHIQPKDILIVSIGANDIALSPTAATMRHMLQLAWLTPLSSIDRGTASSLAYFKHMFGEQTKAYITRMIAKQKPRVVIVCTIYYPLEAGVGQLQAAIRKMYEQATSSISIEGTTVIPCPLFESLDGKAKEDYVERVEPSVQGGKKMATHLVRLLGDFLSESDLVQDPGG